MKRELKTRELIIAPWNSIWKLHDEVFKAKN
jgi:hypothetical protein